MVKENSFLTYLPFIVLIVVFASRIIFLLNFPVTFNSDETVVSAISTQPLEKLFDTIQAEPHPPGLYLLLKLFALDNRNGLKILAVSVGFIISLSTLFYAKKTKLLEKQKLSLGLAFFFSTYGFIDILSNVKQDFVSFPLLLLLFFIALHTIQQKTTKKANFVFIHVILLSLLCFGYVAYFQGLLLVFLLSLYFYKERIPKYLMLFQISVLGLYGAVLGIHQLINNIPRFLWVNEFGSSFIDSIPQFLVGMGNVSITTDVFSVVFALFTIWGIISITSQKTKNDGAYGMLLLAFITFSLGLLSRSFVRTRYVAFFYLLASIFWGWGMEGFVSKYKRFKKLKLFYLFIVIFLGFNIAYSCRKAVVAANGVYEVNTALRNNTGGERTGLIIDHPTEAFLYKLENRLGEDLIPFNVFSPEMTDGEVVTKDFLIQESKYEEVDPGEIKLRFQKKNLKRYLYLFSIRVDNVHYDPNHLVFKALIQYCDDRILAFPNSMSILYLFSNCKF